MHILRACAAQLGDAKLLLGEYYEAVQVVVRDSAEAVRGFVSAEGAAAAGMWIAYVEGVPAGCVVLRPLGIAEPGVCVECKRLYVRPQFRGRGIAEALLAAMEAHALVAGAEWVYLDSKDDLEAALRVYVRRGYQACARYNENPQATIFLRKELRQSRGIPG